MQMNANHAGMYARVGMPLAPRQKEDFPGDRNPKERSPE